MKLHEIWPILLIIVLRLSFIEGIIGSKFGKNGNRRASVQNFGGPPWEIFQKSNTNPIASIATTPEVIRFYGYPAESHRVQTEDGYILTLHRIPRKKSFESVSKEDGPVVFLQHGIFDSSFEWVMNSQEKLIALQLSQAGYDVWMGNSRGNTYSRNHAFLSPSNRKFWEFSVHEMGKYDLPAAIDYILDITKVKKIHYIGFSMGTTTFWVMMSLRPEYNRKVKLMIAFAPVVYLNHMKGPIRTTLAPFEREVKGFIDLMFNGEFLPPWAIELYHVLGTQICSNAFFAKILCANLNFLFFGYNPPQTQLNVLPVFFGQTPSPTSSRTMGHLAQFIQTGTFMEYDFGLMENFRKYGSSHPPKYSLNNTQVPVVLLWGENDILVNPIDVRRLSLELPNVYLNEAVNFSLWNHYDFHLARDVNELVNKPVLQILEKFK